jgi:hypothetical protein
LVGRTNPSVCRTFAWTGHAPTRPAAAPAGHADGKAKISDRKGMDSVKAIDVMTERGFTSVDSLDAGNVQYGIYCNAKTHQCVQWANANNRVDSAVDVHTHPKCRRAVMPTRRGPQAAECSSSRRIRRSASSSTGRRARCSRRARLMSVV